MSLDDHMSRDTGEEEGSLLMSYHQQRSEDKLKQVKRERKMIIKQRGRKGSRYIDNSQDGNQEIENGNTKGRYRASLQLKIIF